MSDIEVPSRNEVKRAGQILIDPLSSDEQLKQAMSVLATWRSLHTYPIDAFQKTLKNKARNLSLKDCIVAQRLKRMPSIVTKLQRFPDMNLARMQDIGGCRIILSSIKDVYRLHAHLLDVNKRFAHEPKLPSSDYIANPKADGYRSLHQVFKYKSRLHPQLDGLNIELQIRTKLQHSWATAVETIGVIERASYKTGDGRNDFKVFFKLCSALFSIKEQTPVVAEYAQLSVEDLVEMTMGMEQQLQVFTKLKGLALTTKHIESSSAGRYAYHLIELSKVNEEWRVSVIPFAEKQLRQAEIFYAASEQNSRGNPDVDVVLVSVGDLKGIKAAYPNYFLDTNVFIRELQTIFKRYQVKSNIES